jgi:hypothetical protein
MDLRPQVRIHLFESLWVFCGRRRLLLFFSYPALPVFLKEIRIRSPEEKEIK